MHNTEFRLPTGQFGRCRLLFPGKGGDPAAEDFFRASLAFFLRKGYNNPGTAPGIGLSANSAALPSVRHPAGFLEWVNPNGTKPP